MLKKILIGAAAVLIALVIVGVYRFSTLALKSREMQPVLSIPTQGLSPCPDKPNCVSSRAERESEHWIAPFVYDGTAREAHRSLIEVLEQIEDLEIREKRENYIHAEIRSDLFGFVDDVEFLFPPDSHQIDVRSASRVGYSDLGANAKRIDRIRRAFEKGLPGSG